MLRGLSWDPFCHHIANTRLYEKLLAEAPFKSEKKNVPMPTNLIKSMLAALLLLLPSASFAQVSFRFTDEKTWLQTGPESSRYLGGAVGVTFIDGVAGYVGCLFNFGFELAGEDPDFCPLGTTAFIAQGDVNNDGVDDRGFFLSVAELIEASMVEPFRPDRFRFKGAPPGGLAELAAESDGRVDGVFDVFLDRSAVVWWNVLAGFPREYKLTGYGGLRVYDSGSVEEARHYRDVPWGAYLFELPRLGQPEIPVGFGVNHLVAPDAYPGRSGVPSGWRITNSNWGDTGRLEVDPRFFFDFTWQGFNSQNTLLNDDLYFSMSAHQYVDTAGVTRTEIPPEDIAIGEITGFACNVLTTDIDMDASFEPGKTYQMIITSGDQKNQVVYPLMDVFGTNAGVAPNEVILPVDFTGGIVYGEFTAVSGLTLTTNRDLQTCLLQPAYELEITSGASKGTIEFPVQAFALSDMTTRNDISAGLAVGDTFVLRPRPLQTAITVQSVSGHFIVTDTDLTTQSLQLGGDYWIRVLTGSLAGKEFEVRDYQFPTDFHVETIDDISSGLAAGDTFEFQLRTPATNIIQPGDTITFNQTFDDWVADKTAAGEIGTPPLGAPAARENVLVFPPYPLETSEGSRREFIIDIFSSNYELGPFFFTAGDSARGQIRLERSNVAALTGENVNRLFRYDVQFIDTYAGFAVLGGLGEINPEEFFPIEAGARERAPDYDWDNDGASNLMEYALGRRVNDPTDKGTPAFKYSLDGAPGVCTATVTKRPFTGSSLKYYFEYSSDLQNWTTILPGDPNFVITTDNETTLEVTNLAQVGIQPDSCFLRVRVQITR